MIAIKGPPDTFDQYVNHFSVLSSEYFHMFLTPAPYTVEHLRDLGNYGVAYSLRSNFILWVCSLVLIVHLGGSEVIM